MRTPGAVPLLERVVALACLAVFAVGCGSAVDDSSTTTSETPRTTSTSVATTATTVETTSTGSTEEQLRRLTEARARWATRESENARRYSFAYRMVCECWQGPFEVLVEGGVGTVLESADAPPDATPYRTIPVIFAEIERTITEGRIPVRVTYDPDIGVPVEYVFNEPELPVDGGFVFQLTDFDPDPGPNTAEVDGALAELERRRDAWLDLGLADYDHVLRRVCFCGDIGPWRVSVRAGEVVDVTPSVDPSIEAEVAVTVDELFDIAERALGEAHDVEIRYSGSTSAPTSIAIDWIFNAVDDEITYESELFPVACSADEIDVVLVEQPALPEAVSATRKAIFEAAAACDFVALDSLADEGDEYFETSFGGGGVDLLADMERRGEPVMEILLAVLNDTPAELESGTWVWPAEFAAADDVFGWRHVIADDGEWLFFIAGD